MCEAPRGRAIGGVALLALLIGCTPTPAAPPGGCTPNASLACACTDGRMGAQVCGADRTLGPCVCSGSDGGTPSGDTGASDDRGVVSDAGRGDGSVERDADTATDDSGTTANDAGTASVDTGVVAFDAGPAVNVLRGGFSPGGVSGQGFQGRFYWRGAVRGTAGGVTLEGVFR